MARLLLEKGASFDARDGARGFTSLMNACEAGHGECVRVLLEAGADPFDKISVPDHGRGRAGKNKLGDAYSCAFRSGHREVVEILRALPQYATSTHAAYALAAEKRGEPQLSPPSSPDEPKGGRKAKKPKRSTPLRDRAEKVGVSDKLQTTPPGIREAIAAGPASSSFVIEAKKKLQATQKANHQIITRAEQQQSRNADQKQETLHADARRKQRKRDVERTAF